MTTHDAQANRRHSPGPYTCKFDRDGCDNLIDIVADDGAHVARIVYWDCDERWSARAQADADLLSSAPQLLAVLESLLLETQKLPVASLDGEFFAAIYSARSILAKLTGGQS
jgi:hypothetical protein